MAFKGILPAPAIEPTEFGLFAVAKPTWSDDASYEDEWTRGFSQEYITLPNYVRNWDETSSTSYVVSSNPRSALYKEVKPIFIEVEDFRSTFDLPGEDRFARILKQLDAVSQKALEYELWNGEIALAQGLPNTFMTSPGVTVIHSAAAHGASYVPRRGLALLEHYVGEMSPAGEHGVVHLTRDSFVLMTSNNQLFMDNKDKQHMQTASGTQVIIGSGYSGDGPHSGISSIAVSSNVATIITTGSHYMKAGETFSVTSASGAADTTFNGTWTVKAVTNTTTFTADITHANQSATAYSGHVQMKGDDDTKWIYATGKVQAHLGRSVVVNDNLAQGYDVSGNANDMRIKATRAAVAYFDPSIHLAIKLDLTV
jgi:hypothetical protein